MAGEANLADGVILNSHASANMALARSKLAQESLAYSIPLTECRVWDAMQTNIPGTAATDDLELNTGTLGTDAPNLQTGDLKAAGATTRYAAFLFPLPPEYVDGQAVTVRLSAGMKTTIADVSATCDVEAYEHNRKLAVGADLCSTGNQSCNSLTFADKDFTITPTSLVTGDILHIRVALAINDAATVTAVIGVIGQIEVLVNIKG